LGVMCLIRIVSFILLRWMDELCGALVPGINCTPPTRCARKDCVKLIPGTSLFGGVDEL